MVARVRLVRKTHPSLQKPELARALCSRPRSRSRKLLFHDTTCSPARVGTLRDASSRLEDAMRAFGAPIRDACADGGGIPRVVAETIAWLDAHGARAFPSDPPTARGVARGNNLESRSSPGAATPRRVPAPTATSARVVSRARAPLLPLTHPRSRRQGHGRPVRVARVRIRHRGREVSVRARGRDAAEECERRARRRGRPEAFPSLAAGTASFVSDVRLPPRRRRGADAIAPRIGAELAAVAFRPAVAGDAERRARLLAARRDRARGRDRRARDRGRRDERARRRGETTRAGVQPGAAPTARRRFRRRRRRRRRKRGKGRRETRRPRHRAPHRAQERHLRAGTRAPGAERTSRARAARGSRLASTRVGISTTTRETTETRAERPRLRTRRGRWI